MSRVLMIAYHFPPFVGSSGVQRTLEFVRHLPAFGWEPGVLTVHPRAYERSDPGTLSRVPEGTAVWRTPALDTARHLSVAGRYIGWMAIPDRWVSWWGFGVLAGVRLVRRFRPDVLWSTYPIATAHLIGASLQRLTGLPWIADFRDPMGQPEQHYPRDPRTRAAWSSIERLASRRAARCVFTTPGAARRYRERFPRVPETRWAVVENGFSEEVFDRSPPQVPPGPPFRLVHSGVLYPHERNPGPFFDALSMLRARNAVDEGLLQVVLRGSAHEDLYREMIASRGLTGLVRLEPPVGHAEAVDEMRSAHGLLLFQGRTCNDQIPAKAYEYLYSDRPVLALTDPGGDTGRLLLEQPGVWLAPMEDPEAIGLALERLITALRQGAHTWRRPAAGAHSRRCRAEELAQILSSVTGDVLHARKVARAGDVSG